MEVLYLKLKSAALLIQSKRPPNTVRRTCNRFIRRLLRCLSSISNALFSFEYAEQVEVDDGTGIITATTFRQQKGAVLHLPNVEPGDIIMVRGRAGPRYREHVDDACRRQVSGTSVRCWAGTETLQPMDRHRHMRNMVQNGGIRRPLVGCREDGEAMLAEHLLRCASKGRDSVLALRAALGKLRSQDASRGTARGTHKGAAPSYGVTDDIASSGARAGGHLGLAGSCGMGTGMGVGLGTGPCRLGEPMHPEAGSPEAKSHSSRGLRIGMLPREGRAVTLPHASLGPHSVRAATSLAIAGAKTRGEHMTVAPSASASK